MTICISNLSVTLANQCILQSVNVDFHAHCFIGLIGPNGSGKSTLLKCIYRTLKDYEGQIEFAGKNIQTISLKELARELAVVAQHNQYNFDFSVKEIVMMGRIPHQRLLRPEQKEDHELVERMLTKVGMLASKDQPYSTLSGGEQQRVILARALTQEPRVLILDEPTNHLDIQHQIDLMKLIKSLNITIISAIHDLNLALAFCDELFVLKEGVIKYHGRPIDVLAPENIQSIYNVTSEIVYAQDGSPHLVYLS